MKYLSNYMERKQTELLDECGAFFAFSDSQFYQKRKEGIKYCSLGGGLICPTNQSDKLTEGLHNIYINAIKEDLKENGKKAIIRRELMNHECYYVGDISDCVEKLEHYPITEKEILEVYREVLPTLGEEYF